MQERLLLISVASCASMAAGCSVHRATAQPAPAAMPAGIANDDAQWQAWIYPGHEAGGYSRVGGSSNGTITWHQSTADPLEQVLAFYADRLGIESLRDSHTAGGMNVDGTVAGRPLVRFDLNSSMAPPRADAPEVYARTFGIRTSDYFLTYFVHRPAPDANTEITLIYDKATQSVGKP